MLRFLSMVVFVGCLTVPVSADNWTQFAGDAQRRSQAISGPEVLDLTLGGWEINENPLDANLPLLPEAGSGVVVYDGVIYAHIKGPDDSNSLVVAYDADTADLIWVTKVDPTQWGLWATPCIDEKNQSVLVASAKRLFALSLTDGQRLWTPVEFLAPIVGASVCIADDLPYTRAFVTDAYFDSPDFVGRLYCINLDDDPNNSFASGEHVWPDGVAIGSTITNTPSYKNGRVYVSVSISNPDDSSTPHIYAFDATTDEPKQVVDITDARIVGLLNGGVAISDSNSLYAVTNNYNSFEGGEWATLCKVNIDTQTVEWVVPALRSNSVPVVVDDMIYLSAGDTYWSYPRVQAFQDKGNTASLLWESLETLEIGGFSNQPVYADGKLYVGGNQRVDGEQVSGAYENLFIVDVAAADADPNIVASNDGFVLDQVTGFGNQPAVTPESVYSMGPAGLARFYQPVDMNDVAN